MALELALRVDNEETVVPKQYPDSLQAQRLSAPTGPGPTCSKRTTRNGGLELTKRTLTHEWCFPKEDPRRGKCPARGPRVYQGTTNILDSDRHPPEATWLPV